MKKTGMKVVRTMISIEPDLLAKAHGYAAALPENNNLSALIRHLLLKELKKAESCKAKK